jgi:response regulator RpfG family c-di-GMP phosphodiesterase
MLCVLLVIEDYSESVFLQILLNKLGFEVEALKNPKLLNESMGRLFPDILVMTGKGKRVNGLEIATSLKKNRHSPKVILTVPSHLQSSFTDAEAEKVDAIISTPVSPVEFLEAIGRMSNTDSQALIEKYKKMKHQIQVQDAETEVPRSSMDGTPPGAETLLVRSEREQRYQKFLKLDNPPEQISFSKQSVVREVKQIRMDAPNPALEEERQAFLKAMFEKKA